MKLSIIVPVYNVEQYLHQCVESLLNQEVGDMEIILVDDGSTDSSGAICDGYANKDPRVKVIHKTNGGLPSARNAGLSEARGEWIMHVDSDDWILPNACVEMLETAEKEGADVVIGGMRMFCDNNGDEKIISPVKFTSDKTASLDKYIRQDWTCLAGTMAKRSLYACNNLKSPEGITWHEDFYLIVRLIFLSQKTISINKPYYQYRQHPYSIMNSWSSNMIESADNVLASTMQFFNQHGVLNYYREALGHRILNIHQNSLLNREFYLEIENIAKKYRSCILNNPKLTWKRKLLYMLHSVNLVRASRIHRSTLTIL